MFREAVKPLYHFTIGLTGHLLENTDHCLIKSKGNVMVNTELVQTEFSVLNFYLQFVSSLTITCAVYIT